MSTSPDGLIDPNLFSVRSTEIDAGAVDRAAAEMGAVGSRVGAGAAEVAQAWRGLEVGYRAPEQERVHALVHPAIARADDVDTRLTRGSRALEHLAHELSVLGPRLADLERRAQQFRDEALRSQVGRAVVSSAGLAVDWRDDPAAVRANDDLLQQHATLMRHLTHASEACEETLRGLHGRRAQGERVPTASAGSAVASPEWADHRGNAPALPQVLIHEENPAHHELDLLGLIPVIGEPADAINAAIYAWEHDWINAGISLAGVVPVVGSAGTLMRIAGRFDGAANAAPRLTQARLDHIVARHWPTAGTSSRVSKFADGTSLTDLNNMIAAALQYGATRPNTNSRLGTIYEVDLGRIIGVSGGRPTSRLRVVVNDAGEIWSAFPF
ncbi:hypothetical protein [Pseudactinotalea terrae]|uniref:hypothetical protein n=1 Tax=Pseudactinotalea terrae TaxID=1743262 RepID=UPI0012E16AC3|nr:hypothetical protein [Pseudactinotalea terrae]